ncbi:G2/M phase-specific E3 ubiquitin-protein ligase-like isoform X1 [Gadus chalcogrammus]|uniref:G2/M phase-specific E3 ubiquitin-protein ligase-like isoform X1 n=2 Tax=Gadus chalcogrammus TaxID=1042646 RepID=UPI0024C2F6F0|nr:G2/M phase-specific E3 ubiquitin-protein ligase-like isoform X1 [Gadus chalcogrammus]
MDTLDGSREGSVDTGGPTREFLTLLMRAILASRFFVGPEDSKHLSLDSIGLNRGTYVSIGKMIAICIVHGGVGPYVFSARLLCQLTGEPAPPVDVMEIDDEELRSQILKIQQASTILEVHAAIASAASNLALLGSLTVIRTMSDRDEVLESALKFYLDKRLHVPLQQLRQGLECLGVLQAAVGSTALRRLFSGGPPAPLTAEQVMNMFAVNYSVRGSSRRSEEERAVGYWRDWLIDVEGRNGQRVPGETVKRRLFLNS